MKAVLLAGVALSTICVVAGAAVADPVFINSITIPTTSTDLSGQPAGANGNRLGGFFSDLYYDRRESISLSAGDGVYSNQVTHMVDPWPAQSANKNIAFDGQKMQSAVERYRTNKTTPLATAQSPVQYQPVLAPAQQPSTTPTQ